MNELFLVEIYDEFNNIQYRYTRYLSQDGAKWIRHGLFLAYYPNGIVSSEGYYEHGLEQGIWKDYHENGILASIGEYKNGEEYGLWKYYDSLGNLDE